jgi:hypothetical protein
MLDDKLKLHEGVEETVMASHNIAWSDLESKKALGQIKRRFQGDSNQCPPDYKLDLLPVVSPWSS